MASGALRLVDARFTVDLHPVLTDVPARGFEEHLSTLLLRYSDDFDGVIVAYDKARVLGRKGTLGNYFPYSRVSAEARLAVFAPAEGDVLRATVNEIGADFISALAMGFVNVTVDGQHIRAEFAPPGAAGSDGLGDPYGAPADPYGASVLGDGSYGEQGWAWKSRADASHALAVGTDIWFQVLRVAHQGEFMHILGSLEARGTGAVTHVAAPAPTATARGAGRGKGSDSARPSAGAGEALANGAGAPKKLSRREQKAAAKAAKEATMASEPAGSGRAAELGSVKREVGEADPSSSGGGVPPEAGNGKEKRGKSTREREPKRDSRRKGEGERAKRRSKDEPDGEGGKRRRDD